MHTPHYYFRLIIIKYVQTIFLLGKIIQSCPSLADVSSLSNVLEGTELSFGTC